jgi:hypothetical protein
MVYDVCIKNRLAAFNICLQPGRTGGSSFLRVVLHEVLGFVILRNLQWKYFNTCMWLLIKRNRKLFETAPNRADLCIFVSRKVCFQRKRVLGTKENAERKQSEAINESHSTTKKP